MLMTANCNRLRFAVRSLRFAVRFSQEAQMAKKGIGLFIVVLLAGVAAAVAAARDDDPETVMITLRAKAGAEAELAQVIADHWATATKMNLVNAEPHVTVRTKGAAGKICFVDIFTWRDRDIPDNAPPAITKIWEEMNRLTESRDGRPGIDIAEVTLAGK
jgi:hypothetical protein